LTSAIVFGFVFKLATLHPTRGSPLGEFRYNWFFVMKSGQLACSLCRALCAVCAGSQPAIGLKE